MAVNVDFSNAELSDGIPAIRIAEDAQECCTIPGHVARSCFVSLEDGTRVGLMGRAPADLFNIVLDGNLPGVDFFGGRDPETDLALVSAEDQVLEQVDILEGMGINIIFLLDHAQDFTPDPLATDFLRGIDVIVSAGSSGFFASSEVDGPFNLLREGDVPTAEYPLAREDMDGNTVLVINSDQLYRYVGMLLVDFDENGTVASFDSRSGPLATTEETIELLEVGTKNVGVEAVLMALETTPTIVADFEVLGTTASLLNGERVPVRQRSTNLGDLTADSTLWFVDQLDELADVTVDVVLKNGGGIRESIVGPEITRISLQAALSFDNLLSVIELTTGQFVATMENSVSRFPAADGRFPQIAGMVLTFDASMPGVESEISILGATSRIQDLIVIRPDGEDDVVVVENFMVVADPDATFVMATNNFLQGGGDGFNSLVAGNEILETTTGEQEILELYIIEVLGGVVDIPDPPVEPRVTILNADV